MKKRTLADLYQVGKDLVLDDGAGGVTVYLKKLNPVDTERAGRLANAARAKFRAARKHEDNYLYIEVLMQHEDVLSDRDAMLDLVVEAELAPVGQAIEAEIAAEEEWKDGDYLQGLFDAWPALQREDLATHEEAKRVLEELTRFRDQVSEAIDQRRRSFRKDKEEMPDDRLHAKALDLLFDREADTAWVAEFRFAQIWLAVRDPKTHEPYFSSREEVDNLSAPVLTTLLAQYAAISVDPIEGKDSRQTVGSSASSTPPAPEEISPSSGPEESAA